jgi:hypothetical protein
MRDRQIRTKIRRRRGERGSTLVLFTLMLPSVLLPLAGLGVDATMLRIVQAKLAAATDGAALGAGRLLGTLANPAEIAGEFLHGNFPANTTGFWGAYDMTPTIVYTPGITKTVSVTATAKVPLMFGRIFGQSSAIVSASSVATRSDYRVLLVIDRSDSMNASDGAGSTVIADAKSFASGFVQKFTPGTDEVGLVVFDGSAVVGYPTGTWTSTINSASTGGPNKTFNDGSANDLPHQISAITASSGTGMAEALSIAYIELQKAHMRDLALDGVDTRLNSIVLLTDGVPSAISLYLNDPSNTNANNMIASGSGCTNKTINPPTPAAANMMKSWFAIPGPSYTGSHPYGLYLLASTNPTVAHTSNWWMSHGGSDAASPNPTTPYAGCTGIMNNAGSNTYSYFSKIPAQDLYGNALNTTGYTNSHVTGGSVSSIYTGTALDLNQEDKDYHWGLAIWNSVDNAAKNIRTDADFGSWPEVIQRNRDLFLRAIRKA